MRVNRKPRPSGVRIISGAWRGTRISVPAKSSARPTPDRVRETLFNWLEGSLANANCLDLFAGSGILGLEALSRGAAKVCFVERDRVQAESLTQQIAKLSANAKVLCSDAEDFLADGLARRFDIVFLDAPYEMPLEPILQRLPTALTHDALIYVERPARTGLPKSTQLEWKKTSRAAGVCYGLAAFLGQSA